MGEIWVYVETNFGEIEFVSLELLHEGMKIAESLNSEMYAIIMGHDINHKVMEKVSQFGVEKVILLDLPMLSSYNPEVYCQAIVQLVQSRQPSTILMGATPDGDDLASRVAAVLQVGLVCDCADFKVDAKGRLLVTKPIYGGRAQATFVSKCEPQIITVRENSIGLGKLGQVKQINVEQPRVIINAAQVRTKVISYQKGDPRTVSLEEAEKIVSGGHGVNGAVQWEQLQKLADTLGAALGGSRMSLDNGNIPRERMVGQTGKTVRPKLYMAVGISGASQHLGGMKESERTIAINKDPNAPIMKLADLAVQAEIEEFLPVLTRELQQRSSCKQADEGRVSNAGGK